MNRPAFLPTEGYGVRTAISIGEPLADGQRGRGNGVSIRARDLFVSASPAGALIFRPIAMNSGGHPQCHYWALCLRALSFREDHRLCFSAHDVKQEDIVPLAAELPLDGGLLLHRAVFNG